MLGAIDWTNVLVALIAGLPAIIAAIFGARIHGQIRTPSGKSLGAVAEFTHDTAIANNLLLARHNGPTVPADRQTIAAEGETPPQIPSQPTPPPETG